MARAVSSSCRASGTHANLRHSGHVPKAALFVVSASSSPPPFSLSPPTLTHVEGKNRHDERHDEKKGCVHLLDQLRRERADSGQRRCPGSTSSITQAPVAEAGRNVGRLTLRNTSALRAQKLR